MSKVGILGAGSWGSALAVLLNNNGHEVTLWSALSDEVKELNEKREHTSKLPGVRISEKILITDDLKAAMEDLDEFLCL